MMRIDWERLKPRYWMQNEPTSWEWDAILNYLMDTYEPEPGYLTVKLGPVEVWVSNWPYSYGNAYRPHEVKVLPSVATRKRLKNLVSVADPLVKVKHLLPKASLND